MSSIQRTTLKPRPLTSQSTRSKGQSQQLIQNFNPSKLQPLTSLDNSLEFSKIPNVNTSSQRSNNRILQTIINHDLSHNSYISPIIPFTTKNSHYQPHTNYTEANTVNKLHKDFGHLNQLLEIEHHHRQNSFQNEDKKQNQYLHHRISNMQSYNKYDEYEDQNNSITNDDNHNTTTHYQNTYIDNNTQQIQQHFYQQNHQQQPLQQQNLYYVNYQQQQFIQMIVQLNSYHSVTLKVHANDDPLFLAKQFCYLHNIDPKIINSFAKQIKQLQFNTWINDPRSNSTVTRNSRITSKNHTNQLYQNMSQVSQASDKQTTSNEITDKENKQFLSNTKNHIHHHKPSNSYHIDRQQQNSTYTTGRKITQTPTTTTNTITNTKTNSRIQYINNNNIKLSMYTSNPHNVFNRLYQNPINQPQPTSKCKDNIFITQHLCKNNYYCKMKNIHHHKHTHNTTDKTKQSLTLNQSPTLLQNLSTQNINTTINPPPSNKDNLYQLKIYNKNTKLQQQSKIRNQQIKQQMEALGHQQYTGNPSINPMSRLIVSKIRGYQEQYQGINDKDNHLNMKNSHIRLYQQSSKSKQKNKAKTMQYTRQRQQQQMKQCSFHPKILNPTKSQSSNTQRFILLHQDYYMRQSKAKTLKASQSKKLYQQQHPKINNISKRLVNGRSFDHRMTIYKSNLQKNKTKITEQHHSLQKFKPQINKNATNKKQPTISIGQYLYSKSLQKKSNSNPKLLPNAPNLHPTNKSSNLMYSQMKKNAFRYIFTLMDSDQDGFISSLKINILGLNHQILQLLTPLLCQMQQVQVQLDQQEFVDALQRLFNTYNINQKNILLNVYKNPLRKSKHHQSPSFHPSLNEKSIQLVKDTRDQNLSLYQLSKQQQLAKQWKLQQLRTIKALMEFQQCTFYPNLIHHH